MKQLQTMGIILARTNYGEADRILTVLTPDQGKLRLLAKGVRRIKSKLAGGIELFSVSHITFIPGRRDLGTLISTRLDRHYGHIVQQIERTLLGYDLIKRLNKATEDEPESAYYDLLEEAFAALDDDTIDLPLIDSWFDAQLLRLNGHMPNLTHDKTGARLVDGRSYEFNFDDAAFLPHPEGNVSANDIKFLRLLFNDNRPALLAKVSGAGELVERSRRLVRLLVQAQQ